MNRVRPPKGAARRAYARTVYRAPGLVVRVGRRTCGYEAWREGLLWIGACNPSGVRLPDGVNARRMAALEGLLARWWHVRGEGRLGAWAEDMFVVAMPLARACVLARRFGQNAVVVNGPGRRARLVWLA